MKTERQSCDMESWRSTRCSVHCLGPLTFHPHIKGDNIYLSQGGLLAERKGDTFRNGLLFSSRRVRLQERVRLRVLRCWSKWNGALRVGFTNVPPSKRQLPLPSLAIPDLSNAPGHWVDQVCVSLCRAGSELEFWVSCGGNVYVSIGKYQHKLLSGVDLSRPLWAVVDLYGQTQAIVLQGSRKKTPLYTRRSCVVLECTTAVDHGDHMNYDPELDDSDDIKDSQREEQVCVVCMEEPASLTLPCGHRCLCSLCESKFLLEFNNCPLCRHIIPLHLPRREGLKEEGLR